MIKNNSSQLMASIVYVCVHTPVYAGQWDFDHTPVSIWKTQIGLGGDRTRVGGWTKNKSEVSVLGVHCMQITNSQITNKNMPGEKDPKENSKCLGKDCLLP